MPTIGMLWRYRFILKFIQGARLIVLLFAQMILCGCTQHGFITTYIGSGLPVGGAQVTAPPIDMPFAISADGARGFYIACPFQNMIYMAAADGKINLTAGIGSSGYSGDGGMATAAKLNHPNCVAVDSAGSFYIADTRNNRIRKVMPTGIISTVVGNGTSGFSGDGGLATAAQLNLPKGVAVDALGNLYIADTDNIEYAKLQLQVLSARWQEILTKLTMATVGQRPKLSWLVQMG
jgi:DNA-binding beta-propeller fold protein YncE